MVMSNVIDDLMKQILELRVSEVAELSDRLAKELGISDMQAVMPVASQQNESGAEGTKDVKVADNPDREVMILIKVPEDQSKLKRVQAIKRIKEVRDANGVHTTLKDSKDMLEGLVKSPGEKVQIIDKPCNIKRAEEIKVSLVEFGLECEFED
ncbi:MAG: hypothetical protein P857_672 [Candidatus Xenolissoclinum pacificiensis L6]|uniref:50S ribosomal protein L7/L12 n=1 Tax=Candidatus Xenolissoclinum pacificiensis L6 TaxID=1401685 RepID=W2V167_9RICK|nr:MAG: hypothetical protein P857_672 [Candidatus Xenolissoclinum pacificiensis L6]